MDFFDVVEQRRSTRAFSTRPIEPDKTLALLEAVNRAPSAGNLQAYEVYLVRNQAVKAALAAAALEQRFIAAAPVVLVFCAHPERAASYGERGRRLYALQDATIACTFAMLAASSSTRVVCSSTPLSSPTGSPDLGLELHYRPQDRYQGSQDELEKLWENHSDLA